MNIFCYSLTFKNSMILIIFNYKYDTKYCAWEIKFPVSCIFQLNKKKNFNNLKTLIKKKKIIIKAQENSHEFFLL